MKNGRYFWSPICGYYKTKNHNYSSIEWYKDNKHHCEDGPAIIWSHGAINWYINGNCISNQVNEWIKEHNYPSWKKWDDAIKIHFKMTFG